MVARERERRAEPGRASHRSKPALRNSNLQEVAAEPTSTLARARYAGPNEGAQERQIPHTTRSNDPRPQALRRPLALIRRPSTLAACPRLRRGRSGGRSRHRALHDLVPVEQLVLRVHSIVPRHRRVLQERAPKRVQRAVRAPLAPVRGRDGAAHAAVDGVEPALERRAAERDGAREVAVGLVVRFVRERGGRGEPRVREVEHGVEERLCVVLQRVPERGGGGACLEDVCGHERVRALRHGQHGIRSRFVRRKSAGLTLAVMGSSVRPSSPAECAHSQSMR